MKDINKHLRDIAEKSRKKRFKHTIKEIIKYIRCMAEDGFDNYRSSFAWHNISGELLKAAVLEELRNRGYNVTWLQDEDEFIVDWSRVND